MSFHNFQDDTDDLPWWSDEELNQSLTEPTTIKQNTKENNMSFADKFKALKAQAAQTVEVEEFEEKGTIGGGKSFKIENDGVYVALIDMVSWHESKSSGSAWYEIKLKTEDGQRLNTKLFVLNKDGKTADVDKDGRLRNTVGFNRMCGLNYIVTGEWDGLPVPETKEVMVYDHSVNSEVAKEMQIVTSLIGKPVAVTVKMQLEDGYPDATVERLVPEIRNILDAVTLQSATEKRKGESAKVVEDFKAAIEKSPAPIDKRDKSKGGASTTSTTASSTPAKSFGFSK